MIARTMDSLGPCPAASPAPPRHPHGCYLEHHVTYPRLWAVAHALPTTKMPFRSVWPWTGWLLPPFPLEAASQAGLFPLSGSPVSGWAGQVSLPTVLWPWRPEALGATQALSEHRGPRAQHGRPSLLQLLPSLSLSQKT